MRHVIALTAADRPQYLARTLESWAAVKGIERSLLLFAVEPGNEAVRKLCEGWDACPSDVRVNPVRLGALSNPWHAFEWAFQYDDYAVMAEDDSIVAEDVLEYLNWCRRAYQHDRDVLAVCTYRKRPKGPGGLKGLAGHELLDWFCPTIWATWYDRWRGLIRDSWDHDYSTGEMGVQAGWDWHLRLRVMPPRKCVFPFVSRSSHIGEHGGVHATPETFPESVTDQLATGVRHFAA